jgi:hypothetical protein
MVGEVLSSQLLPTSLSLGVYILMRTYIHCKTCSVPYQLFSKQAGYVDNSTARQLLL